jgi:HlyD family secretion protein
LADATRAQLRAQSARLEQLKNVLARQRQQLESLQLRAGMTGVVQALAVQVGQQLAAGAQVARVAALHDLVAELQIPEVNARDLMAGQAAHIDTRNGIAEGKVSRVDPAVANGAVRVEVQFTGELPHGARPDLSVDGVIEIERRPDSLYVARPATGDPESRASVFRLDPDGHARRIAVQLGKASVSEVQVLAGLAAGDRIIVSDVSQWSSSDELRIR